MRESADCLFFFFFVVIPYKVLSKLALDLCLFVWLRAVESIYIVSLVQSTRFRGKDVSFYVLFCVSFFH